jgi:hypothetical protein
MAAATATTQDTDRMTEAVREYIGRKERTKHPCGTFDKAQRWYPTDDERRDCCQYIRSPTRSYPYSYMKHCRSAEHVAALYGVDAKALKRTVRAMRKITG